MHPAIFVAEGLPTPVQQRTGVWRDRCRSIADLERHLNGNGTRIIKFYLHISKHEQCKGLIERIDDPEKNWKVSLTDLEERKFWQDYQYAYEEALSATSTAQAPWYVVPADDKETARLIVSRIVVDILDALDMHYPLATAERDQELLAMRAQLSS